MLMRVDASREVGLGHFYRSLHTAQEMTRRGWKITVAHHPSEFWRQETIWPYNKIKLTDEVDQICLDFIMTQDISAFYVDAILEFKATFIKEIKKYCPVIFYQNLSDSRHLADVFISPSLTRTQDFYEVFSSGTKVYEGLNYFVGHPDLNELPIYKSSACEEVQTVAFTAGGSDPKDTLWQLYQYLREKRELVNTRFYFFYGLAYNRSLDTLPKEDERFIFTPYNRKAILSCDLLVSAFGVSTYEFLALGMPIIAFGHQESNARVADQLALQTGALYNLGNIQKLQAEDFWNVLKRYCRSKIERERLRSGASRLLDLHGVKRVANIIEEVVT